MRIIFTFFIIIWRVFFHSHYCLQVSDITYSNRPHVRATLKSLDILGILDFILREQKVSLSQICNTLQVNEDYRNVGLRLLASQGWLEHTVDNSNNQITDSVNTKSKIVFRLIERYKEILICFKFQRKASAAYKYEN